MKQEFNYWTILLFSLELIYYSERLSSFTLSHKHRETFLVDELLYSQHIMYQTRYFIQNEVLVRSSKKIWDLHLVLWHFSILFLFHDDTTMCNVCIYYLLPYFVSCNYSKICLASVKIKCSRLNKHHFVMSCVVPIEFFQAARGC